MMEVTQIWKHGYESILFLSNGRGTSALVMRRTIILPCAANLEDFVITLNIFAFVLTAVRCIKMDLSSWIL